MIELEGLEPHEVANLVKLRPILLAYRGSRAHGMYVPSTDPDSIDDIDLIECYIPELDHYFGLERGPARGHNAKVRQYDMAAYELRHFAHLLTQANPNVVASLWLKPEEYMVLSSEGRALIENRKLFSSQRAIHSFVGYSVGQLKRMTAYHESGEDHCCDGEKFHTPECPLTKEKGRGSAKKFATGYMGAKRKALVEKFGYDTKNAAHCIRLLRMGLEFIKTGEMVVDRRDAGDAEELLDIKRGEWPLARVQVQASTLLARLTAEDCVLEPEPDVKAINNLLLDLLCRSMKHGAHAEGNPVYEHWLGKKVKTTVTWWRQQQKCRKPGHHHTRDKRYCYWSVGDTGEAFWVRGAPWFVRDRVTGRQVQCKNIRQVRTWIRAARVFQPSLLSSLRRLYKKCK